MPGAELRRSLPVLVAQADSLGAVGVIRSLGRAGYPVHAMAERRDALGLVSRYAAGRVVCPRYRQPGFIDWLQDYVRRHAVRAIVPSESLLLAVRPAFTELSRLLPLSTDEGTVYRGLSKCDLFERLLESGDRVATSRLPPCLLLRGGAPLPDAGALDALGPPLFLKVDGAHSRSGELGRVVRAESGRAAREALPELFARFGRVLVQGYVPGEGVGAFSLLWDGRVVGEFLHHRLHEVPHTGGASSLRESFRHADVRDDALAKLRCVGWQGVAMMEYRWDPATDDFRLMEMNGRFWGSLHLALHAGVDFPRLLLDAFHGLSPRPIRSYPVGLRCRYTFPKEVQHVWSRLKDRRLGAPDRLRSVGEFVLLSLDPRVRADLWFPGDRRLYLRAAGRFLWRALKEGVKWPVFGRSSAASTVPRKQWASSASPVG